MNLRLTKSHIVTALMFVAVTVIGARDAAANSILVFYNGNFFNGTSYTYTYEADLTTRSRIQTGDYFTIYDFSGQVGTTSQPANWAFSTALSGPVPAGTLPTDSSLITNITWTYTGLPNLTSFLGLFNVDSIYGGTILNQFDYAARDHSLTGGLQGNLGNVEVPLAVAVPEPASMMLFGSALLGLGVAARKRLSRK